MSEEKKLSEEKLNEERELPKDGKVSKRKYLALVKENEELMNKAKEWESKYYRAYADTENLRKQYDQDHRNAIKYRAYGFIEKLIPVLDSFHVALSNEPTDPVLKNYLTGFEYIYRQLLETLDAEGVKEFAPEVGKSFDGTYMHALGAEENEEVPANTVLRVYGNCYKLHERIVRPALVIVAKAQEEKVSEEEIHKEQVDQSSDLA
ncbi:MAG: nucleotide exchange factor GrpE [Bacilli bacterium]|jgi:molecular chaperone GrpE